MQFSNKRLQISDSKDYTREQNFNLSPILCQNDSFSAPNFVFLKKKFLKKKKIFWGKAIAIPGPMLQRK